MADITITELSGYGLAGILPHRGVDTAQVGAALGIVVLPGGRASGDEDLALLGTGPGQWLAYAHAGGSDWAAGLSDRLAGLAGVVDQSSGYAMVALMGADARRLLQKGLPVDLSPAVFAPGAVVVSAIAHIGVIAYHLAPDLFHIAVFRSFADSFRHWLDTSIPALSYDQSA